MLERRVFNPVETSHVLGFGGSTFMFGFRRRRVLVLVLGVRIGDIVFGKLKVLYLCQGGAQTKV